MTAEARRVVDARAPRALITLLAVAGAIGAGFAIGAAVQTVSLQVAWGTGASTYVGQFFLRLLVNLAAVALALAGARWLRILWRHGTALVLSVAAISLGAALFRAGGQVVTGIAVQRTWQNAGLETTSGTLVVALSLSAGLVAARLLIRLQREERRAAEQEYRAASALDALQAEELRVRRDVAEGLHGSVQQRLVLVGTRIDKVVRQITEGGSRNEAIADLIALRHDLDQLRQVDVREMSQMLYPDGLEVGLVQAVRIMVRRVPSTILVELSIAPEVNEIDTYARVMTDLQRLNLIRIIEEGVSNALRHGHASKLRVALLYGGGTLRVEVEDDGGGLPPDPHLGGLALLRHRLELLGGNLLLRTGDELGGALLIAELPLVSAAEESIAEG